MIMPVHLGNHWTCAVIDLAAKELVYHDSMGVGPSLTDNDNAQSEQSSKPIIKGQLLIFMGCMGKGTMSVLSVLHMCADIVDVWRMPMQSGAAREVCCHSSLYLAAGQAHGDNEGAQEVCGR